MEKTLNPFIILIGLARIYIYIFRFFSIFPESLNPGVFPPRGERGGEGKKEGERQTQVSHLLVSHHTIQSKNSMFQPPSFPLKRVPGKKNPLLAFPRISNLEPPPPPGHSISQSARIESAGRRCSYLFFLFTLFLFDHISIY